MQNRSLPLLVLCMLSIGVPVFAQQPPSPDSFQYLFPKPTGKNGYEELVFASVLLNRNEEAKKIFTESSPPLTEIRRLFKMPDVMHARDLFYIGIRKRISIPRDPQELDENTRFPEFAEFRSYARFHAKEIYLALADGKNSEAIEALRTGLQFGHQIQMQTIIAGLVGIAIDAIVLRPFDGTLEVLSVKDCLTLQHLVDDWLALPSSITSVVDGERQWMQRMMAKAKKNPSSLIDTVETVISSGDEDLAALQTQREIQKNIGKMDQILEDASNLMEGYYQEVLKSLTLPPYKRKPLPEIPKTTLASNIVGLFLPSMGTIQYRYDRERSLIQMLGVRTALRAYHWEYGRFPVHLSELRLGEKAIDPFTGKPFLYQLDKDTYTLKADDSAFNK